MQGTGPYWIAGYSFGSLIAFEIAVQLQSDGKKVEKLIMLDGSPMYIQAQIAQAIQRLPTNATNEQVSSLKNTIVDEVYFCIITTVITFIEIR